MLFVVSSSGGAGGHEGAASGPQVAGARVGGAGVQRVVRGGAAPTPPSAPAGPEHREYTDIRYVTTSLLRMLGRNPASKC